jgi:F420-dependent oxidoreductase-like protein
MKLGVMIEGQEGLTWQRWRRIIAAAEELGFESLWRSDHFASKLEPERESLETWVSLTLAAAETTRLRFGPLVCPMTFRHPSLLARMAAAVDVLSGGRLVLGLGAGWNEDEHRAFGLPFPPLKERMDMLEEGIQVIIRLQVDEPAYFAGRHYRLEGANPRPKPARSASRGRIPLLIGGKGQGRALRLVARYADEWDAQGAITPAVYRARSQRLAEYCAEVDRDPAEIRRCVSTAYLVGHDQTELRRRGEAMQRLMPHLAPLDPSLVPDTLERTGWLVGTPAQLVACLQSLADEGVERVMLQHNDQTDFEAMELVAREVMPALATTNDRS